jgi:hypothetical protein
LHFNLYYTQSPQPFISVIKSMSLNQKASDPRTFNGIAKVQSKARTVLKRVGVERLIATPISWIWILER